MFVLWLKKCAPDCTTGEIKVVLFDAFWAVFALFVDIISCP